MNIQKEIAAIFSGKETYLKEFQKHTYEEAFRRFQQEANVFLAAIAAQRETGEAYQDPAVFCNAVAEQIIEYIKEQERTDIKKVDKEAIQRDYNMFMATYFFPAVLEVNRDEFNRDDFNRDDFNRLFTQTIEEKWDAVFAHSKIKAATFETVNSGFKFKLCYITTAVCQSLNKGESCYELTLLKDYRDSYLVKQEEGEALIHRYYDVAPTILKRIQKEGNAESVYKKIWDEYLRPCVRMIEDGQMQECQEVYTNMVLNLYTKYIGEQT